MSVPPSVIPTRAAVRWQEFRIQWLPPMAFGVVLILVVILWREGGVGGLTAMATAEGSLVSAPLAGLLAEVRVAPYEEVRAGQVLAILRPQDPRGAFDLLQAQLTLERLDREPSLAQANALDFERLRAEHLRTQSEVAVARVNLERAEKEVARYTPLRDEQLISEDLLELSVRTRDALRAEVEAKQRTVEFVEDRLVALRGLGDPGADDAQIAQNARDRMAGWMETARAQLEPLTLVAPRDGTVQAIVRQVGEHVVAGEPLMYVSPGRADRLVGYLRQPYPVDLQRGQPVEVITRDRVRRVFVSEVAHLGAQVEVITNALAFVRPNALVDSGLPFVVRLPADVSLRPGELVDVHLMDPSPSNLP